MGVGVAPRLEGTAGLNILVTGGAGYIGSHTAKVLARAGANPIVLDNLSRGHRWAVRWGTFLHGDLADSAFLREVFARYSIDAVVHLAALAYVGESMEQPGMYFRNNTSGALNLLEAMRDANVRRIVFSSTCATYGHVSTVPITEEMPQRPVNPYGESKLMVERMLHWFGTAHGLQWVALRYFNAAGADPEGEIGELHSPETHLIPLAIAASAGEIPSIEVFGTDYPTPDGTCLRDYIHVMDLAEAHRLALEYLAAGGTSTAFNLGTGRPVSVRGVLEAVRQVSGKTVPARYGPRRAGDPPELVADPAKARRLLCWRPQYDDITALVSTAWDWYNGGLRRVPASEEPQTA